jgi:ATP-binding cassette subfamily C protein LapB
LSSSVKSQTLLENQGAYPESKDLFLECLLLVAKELSLLGNVNSALYSLPLQVDDKLTLDLLPRAAENLGLYAEVMDEDFKGISFLKLPIILILNDGSPCVLKSYDAYYAHIIDPNNILEEEQIELKALYKNYSGVCVLFSELEKDKRQQDFIQPKIKNVWYKSALQENSPLLLRVALCALFVNLFALASPLFIMNVYDRVIPNEAMETLWVLAVGVIIVFIFDYILKTLRTYFVDRAGII